jgi:hypothetical protein
MRINISITSDMVWLGEVRSLGGNPALREKESDAPVGHWLHIYIYIYI